MKNNIFVLAICFVVVVAVHHILGVPKIINTLALGRVLDMTIWFEYLAIAAIFTGIFIDHMSIFIDHMRTVGLSGGEREEKHGFSFRELLLGIGTVSTSAGVFYFLQSVPQ